MPVALLSDSGPCSNYTGSISGKSATAKEPLATYGGTMVENSRLNQVCVIKTHC